MVYKRLSAQIINKIISRFCEEITAVATAKPVKVNRKTINNYYNDIRNNIPGESLKESPLDDGAFELDESYFAAKRVRGKRGRGAAGETPVFGLLKRGGKVSVKMVKNR
jgi:transposase